jgi:hypothetical protein
MPRVMIDRAVPNSESLDIEIARLRGLDLGGLRARWHTVFRRRAPLTCLATCCFAYWHIGFRQIIWAISIPTRGACSTDQATPLRSAGSRQSATTAGLS